MSLYPERPFNELVAQLKESQRPLARWAGRSLEEIYLGEDLSFSRVKGPPLNLKYTPRALRVVGLHKEGCIGLGIVLFDATRDELHAVGRELRSEQASLPNVGAADNPLSNAVTRALSAQGKQTVAALELSRSIDGSKIVQVLYPKLLRSLVLHIFGDLGMRLNETTERNMALGIAIKFLNSVPYSSEPTILTPENSTDPTS